ncbi:MAG: insulinase family protein [Spirochaetales bacterium]|nr:insulinase family protein [Spirochaetales bacterium]
MLIHGFRLIKKDDIPEIHCKANIYEHDTTGAGLLFLDTKDDNKVFSIFFKTLPGDNTGVPHILEHSVLCGSGKYPTKEPFVELAKGSLKTFLNAFTFSDKTGYPIASKNEKDFFNLMDVYLDAVFNPNIYKYEEIFMQEGWHYELQSREEELKYKGVVYNEMKGVFSSPESILMRLCRKSLYPDTVYRFESGGDPEAIPELTYEQFLSFHKENYHPSNSYIIVYGNVDVEKVLKKVNDDYLHIYTKRKTASSITIQKKFTEMHYIEAEYPVQESEDENGRNYFALNFSTGLCADPVRVRGMEILEYALMESPASPLKNAILNAKIGKDVFGIWDDGCNQPFFSVVVKNCDFEKQEEFKKIYYDTLHDIMKKGIDKKLFASALNKIEFSLREAEYQGYPKGLVYSINAMMGWLYGDDPLIHLGFDNTLKTIKSEMDNGFFEKLITDYLLKNQHGTFIVLKPQKGLAGQKEAKLAEKLNEIKSRMSEEEIDTIIRNTAHLIKRQSTPDTKEDLDTIPKLELSDIKKEVEWFPLQEREIQDIKELKFTDITNDIIYNNLYFDVRAIAKEDLQYLSLLADILSKIDTTHYSYVDLSKEVDSSLGQLHFYISSFTEINNPDNFSPKFIVKTKFLKDKKGDYLKILEEILLHTRFTNQQRVREIIQEVKSRYEMHFMNSGHSVTIKRLGAYLAKGAAFEEHMGNISYYRFLTDLEKNYDEKREEIASRLKDVYNLVINRNNLISGIITESDVSVAEDLSFIKSTENKNNNDYNLILKEKREGFIVPGMVQYVSMGGFLKDYNKKYNGIFRVLSKILSLDYLWNKVRVQGGAYGGFSIIRPDSYFGASSYRDPNLKETLEIYENIPDYLNTLDIDDNELTKYVIGTIGSYDNIITPYQKGMVALERYFIGSTKELLQQHRDEILSISIDKLKNLKDPIKELIDEAPICVIGSEGKIKENENLFDSVKPLF